MLTIGGIGFAQPWLFLGFLALPVLWWLARVFPPPPKIVHFPAIQLLTGLSARESETRHSPLWLLLLRALIIILIITGLTQPVINPAQVLTRSDPVLIIVENSWSSAGQWENRKQTVLKLMTAAQRVQAPLYLLMAAPEANGGGVQVNGPLSAARSSEVMISLTPEAWDSDPVAVIDSLVEAGLPSSTQVFWLADTVTQQQEAELKRYLERYSQVTIYASSTGALILQAPELMANGFAVSVTRTAGEYEQSFTLLLEGDAGQILAQKPATFDINQMAQRFTFDIPASLRNQVRRVTISGSQTIGSTLVLDESWRRKSVGVLTRGAARDESPLLEGAYYVSRALEPFADVSMSTLLSLLEADVSAIVEAAGSRFEEAEQAALERWITDGGVLIRFASSRLAVESNDTLLPVPIRRGERLLGSALSWDRPAGLADFNLEGVFAGLKVPDDIRVKQQILALESAETAENTLLRLQDGTPVVTGRRIGEGWLVLFHISANPEWSNLPLSIIFPEMMERLVNLADAVAPKQQDRLLVPLQSLNAFGQLASPAPVAQSIDSFSRDDLTLSPQTAPGIYRQGDYLKALNLDDFSPNIRYAGFDGFSGQVQTYHQIEEIQFTGPLFGAALVLFILESILVVVSRHLKVLFLSSRAVGFFLVALTINISIQIASSDALAKMSRQDKFLAAVQGIHLAYVVTGDSQVDDMSYNGLRGLSDVLARRTSVEPMYPVGLDVNDDDLEVWPFLYWPVTSDFAPLPDETITRLNVYLRTGGTILFDTRDELLRQATGVRMIDTENGLRLARLLNRLDIPPLQPIPSEHVLSRTFYLLQDYPGRYAGGHVWVEVRDHGDFDGVSGVIIGSHDWASAWAVDEMLQNPVAIIPDGEFQREQAYRFGVNVIMYVLTGNYKSDQVHIPAILERLGH